MDNLEDLGMRGADHALSNGLDREGSQTNGREKPKHSERRYPGQKGATPIFVKQDIK